ncbi:MarR family winged helix-turn-helix transcriptional regulator [Curtobacterium sp. VKM Ac-1376]|uniref:MarR family winged helix-turn-helix transcriptional regulator n=1 Tax=Curtobacterium sp. VKM Ac-1376 TaxID=123312 RepID=UPI00188C1681|nr:MarR family transcriptional regulator [Curtobacterium sp. VKM Ac-1376]MBF4615431.1 MarR family transcriptional regulator [Curtobacterium sp. VKM Ac-1376]
MGTENHAHSESDLFAQQPRTAEGAAAIASLQALSDSIHDADEQALRAMGMLPIDALALRHLVLAHRDGRAMHPTQLARALRLSTAGATKLIDRLVRDGRAERRPNPTDRRGIIVTATAGAEQDLVRAYGHIRAPLIETIDALSDDEATAVQRFASRLAEALRQEFPAPEPA